MMTRESAGAWVEHREEEKFVKPRYTAMLALVASSGVLMAAGSASIDFADVTHSLTAILRGLTDRELTGAIFWQIGCALLESVLAQV